MLIYLFILLQIGLAKCQTNLTPAFPVFWENTLRLPISYRKTELVSIAYANICESISNNETEFSLLKCMAKQNEFLTSLNTFCNLKSSNINLKVNNRTKTFGLLFGSDEVIYSSYTMNNKSELIREMFLRYNHYHHKYPESYGKSKCNYLRKLDRLNLLIKLNIQLSPNDSKLNLELLKELILNFRYSDQFLAIPDKTNLLSCAVNNAQNIILLVLDLAIGQENTHIFQARPFSLYEFENDQWCKYNYTGPNFAIFNQSKLNSVCFSNDELNWDCSEKLNKIRHFERDQCSENYQTYKLSQIRKIKNKYHIYCPGQQIIINNRPPIDCPNFVFELSVLHTFSLNLVKSYELVKTDDHEFNTVFNNLLFDLENCRNWTSNYLNFLSSDLVSKLIKYSPFIFLILIIFLLCLFIMCLRSRKSNKSKESNKTNESINRKNLKDTNRYREAMQTNKNQQHSKFLRQFNIEETD